MYGLNGPLVSLGEFREIKNFNIGDKEIVVTLQLESSDIKLSINEDSNLLSSSLDLDIIINSLSYRKQKLHYLSCHRIGCQDFYHKNMYSIDPFGINGEYTINYLMEHGSDELDENLIKSKNSYTLLYQVNYWLKYIIGANINIENIVGTDIVKAQYSIIEGISSRPKNVGSGISYLISILIMCLGSKKNDIIIIENPEIHLHPLSQSRLCQFLYFIGRSGRQLFVETHSDHFFNGIRAGIATNEMKNEDIKVLFFNLNEKNCTLSTEISFGKSGKILNPVDNLFDQFDIDLNKMLGL
jgi:predicted ATPase